ncbi:hypothetical protein RV09_GL003032 [Enterococcus moraviensis]|nr:hypothetical protein RV09_GL003032 [Enterococcus moraviensis]
MDLLQTFEVSFFYEFQKMHVKSCSKKKQWYTANEANLLITE